MTAASRLLAEAERAAYAGQPALAHRLLGESLEMCAAWITDDGNVPPGSTGDNLGHVAEGDVAVADDDLATDARLLRAKVYAVWADLCDLDGWLHRSGVFREQALDDFGTLLRRVRVSGSVAAWTGQIEAGTLGPSHAPALVGMGRLCRQLGDTEVATMWLQGALLVSSAEHQAEFAAAAFVELAEAMATDEKQSAGFLMNALDCLRDEEPHPLRTVALTRLAEAGWRVAQPDEAEQLLERAEQSASGTGDIVRAAECASLRGDDALTDRTWSAAARHYLAFADVLLDAYPLYVAGRMAHRARLCLDLGDPGDGQPIEGEARDAALELARCGHVGLSTQVDVLRELLTATHGGEPEDVAEADLAQMGDLCAAVGRDLAEAEVEATGGSAA